MPARLRSYLLIPLCIALCSIAAGVFSGGGVHAAPSSDDPLNQSARSFTKVFDLVEQNYADPVKPEKAIYKGAIPGMLRTLDPHSNFFDAQDYSSLREDQQGRYFGVGMTVGPRDSKTIVIAPFGGSPAYRAGLRPGDVLTTVNDHKTEGLTTSEVATLLKGPRGTKVQIIVVREGSDKPLVFNIIRDEIPRFSVPDGFYIKPGIAYLRITQFNENTSKEMDDKLSKIGEKDVKGLVLDLRDNPGGLLNEGVDVTSHFLKRGELVVSHHGRASPNKNYYAQTDGAGRNYPIVVLVNRFSASAAEILTGALQDHDRAWVLGENTFGKGLVQTVYPLSDNAGLALTTAHYYTPSGRLIQRDYSNISFLDYYYHTNLDQKTTSDVKMTDGGRTVYGGNGITPDEKFTPPKLDKFQIDLLLRKYAFFNFSSKYFGAKSDAHLPKGWEPDAALVKEFHDFLQSSKIEFSEADFTSHEHWIKEQLKREMYITAFSFEESTRVAIEMDPAVTKAVESMPKAKGLLENAKKQIVQRLGSQERARQEQARR